MASSSAAALPIAHYLDHDIPAQRKSTAPALRYFESSTFDEARDAACTVYAGVQSCLRCRRVLALRFDRLGSTLFRDDDPRSLVRAFDAADRDGCTIRLLAACVVLFGRDRMSVH